jgi:dipeptidyl aminopeptidase/acylaminoacyl peptidase
LWVYENGESRQLTNSMAGWKSTDFSTTEHHFFPAREGFKIPGLLYKPVDFNPDNRYPAVIVIHGGFYGQWINNFDQLGQYLLQRGMVLFYPNPRGGGGQGRMYERLNDGDWGGGDVDDLLGAHDYIRSLPYIDGDRVAIWGGSYGGYLVYALVTTEPERFQAAVVRAGINDLRTQVLERIYSPVRLNNTSSYIRQIGGLPDDNPDFYRERSPITRVTTVKTPMLIMHGLRDNRVSPSQSRIWVQALRQTGTPVISAEYPHEDHSLLRYKTTMSDQLKRMTALFEEYLQLPPSE